MNSDLEKYYKKFNFPAASTFWIKLKAENIKVTKKQLDEFIASRVEQQQTTIKAIKKRNSGKIVAYYPLSLIQMDIFDLSRFASSNKQYKYILCIIDGRRRCIHATSERTNHIHIHNRLVPPGGGGTRDVERMDEVDLGSVSRPKENATGKLSYVPI
jgi:hypothetical protein